MESDINQSDEEEVGMFGDIKLASSPRATFSRTWMSSALICSDTITLLISVWVAVAIRMLLGQIASRTSALAFLSLSQFFDPAVYFRLIPVLAIFPIVYASRRLYPTVGLNRVDEIRQIIISTSIVITIYATLLFLTQQGLVYSRLILGLFCLLALMLVPVGRVLVRKILVRLSLWGVPVGVVGAGPKAAWTADFLGSHPILGFKPVVIFDDGEDTKSLSGMTTKLDIHTFGRPGSMRILQHLDTLVVVQEETPADVLEALVSDANISLPRIVMMPDLPDVGSVWVWPVDLGGVLALKIRNNLANPWQCMMKRVLDVTLGLLIMLISAPIMMLIAIVIRIDSKGSIFYAHTRIGYGGRKFKCWKFRTMIQHTDEMLQAYLKRHPEPKRQWKVTQKLKDDPRITRVGKLLRKLSLDELPQLWNVLQGEMSLVGPRPIMDAETRRYKENRRLYCSVRPGITGMWQVHGRNDIGYESRVALDSYYVRNWSIWLDLYILAKTPLVVLTCKGAY
jgi:Undecaprenyl-phosphate galactose phosphotransferase WbaP